MEKTYNPALIQRTQRYMETHSISLPLPLARWWTAAEAKSSESCPLRSVPVV